MTRQSTARLAGAAIAAWILARGAAALVSAGCALPGQGRCCSWAPVILRRFAVWRFVARDFV